MEYGARVVMRQFPNASAYRLDSFFCDAHHNELSFLEQPSPAPHQHGMLCEGLILPSAIQPISVGHSTPDIRLWL